MAKRVIAAGISLTVGVLIGWVSGSSFERQEQIRAFVSLTAETDAILMGVSVIYARLLRDGKLAELQEQLDRDICNGLVSISERVRRGDIAADSEIAIITTSELRRYIAEHDQDDCVSDL